MRAMYKKIVRTLSQNLPQCYETANYIYDQMRPYFHEKIYTSDAINDLSLINELYKLQPSLTIIEIHMYINSKDYQDPVKIRKQYNIKNRFWIPRVFNHSFNILIRHKHVYIAQSWFRVSNYKIIYKLNHVEFIEWLNKFKYAIEHYGTDPYALFNLFKYFKMMPNDNDIRNLTKYIKDQHLKGNTVNTHLIVKTLSENDEKEVK